MNEIANMINNNMIKNRCDIMTILVLNYATFVTPLLSLISHTT